MIPLVMPVEAPTWPTCTITYSIHGLKKRDREANRFAIKHVRRVTGYRIRRVRGRAQFTGYTLTSGGAVTIRYRDMARHQLGWGGYQANQGNIYWGYVHVNRLRMSKNQRRSVFMHEWGHALGLQHAKTSRDVMYPWNVYRTKWGKGDRRALHKISRDC